jgi:undecaprenyl-diphosphatase
MYCKYCKNFNYEVKTLTIINLLGFIVTSILVKFNYTKKFDAFFIKFMKVHKQPSIGKFAKTLCSIASPTNLLIFPLILLACIFLLLLLFNKWNKNNNIVNNLKVLFCTILVAFFSNGFFKNLFKRARPSAKAILKIDKYSFPSDHAMMAFAFFITIAYILCQYVKSKAIKIIIWFLCLSITILIGLSRVYLQKHFMTDIIGGYFLSGFILCFFIWIINIMGTHGDAHKYANHCNK